MSTGVTGLLYELHSSTARSKNKREATRQPVCTTSKGPVQHFCIKEGGAAFPIPVFFVSMVKSNVIKDLW